MFCYQIHKKWKSSLKKVKMSGMNNQRLMRVLPNGNFLRTTKAKKYVTELK